MVSIDIHMLPKEIPDLFAITQSLAMSGISLLVCYGSPSCESRGLESNTWLITHHDQLTISRHTGRSTYPRHGFCSTPPIPGSTRAHNIQMSLTRLFQQVAIFGAVALVFSVFGVNQGIFTNVPSLEAMAAG